MGYRSLRECVEDLRRHKQLVQIDAEIDPHLEAAEIQRRVYAAGGPALLLANVKGCRFPMACNLFGTLERTRFLFRDSLDAVRQLVELKIDPGELMKRPFRYLGLPRTLWSMWIRKARSGPVMETETTIDQLPQLKCWSDDGGSFITLPQVYTEHPDHRGFKNSNLGMYRVQLSGNDYLPNREIGLHYQIHRSIGVHHAAAIERGEKLRVNIFVGGPPAMTLAAVMPLPEGLSELLFAAALGRRPIRMITGPQTLGLPIYADADFCILGSIDPRRTKLEGPFGDHLGYYSLRHEFPVMDVDHVYCRRDAIWPFTVVGRPPQEDTSFGAIIHEITGPIIPTVIAGVKAIHAVDAAGVHPLLLAIGSERYVPYAAKRSPQELLTTANAILGQGQLSLAKYLFIIAGEDQPDLDIHDLGGFFRHVLERVDWRRDLHFQTRTTIDTLDYSGSGFNEGSKVVVAAAGPPVRELGTALASDLPLPAALRNPRLALPGVIVAECRDFPVGAADSTTPRWPDVGDALKKFPLIVLVDDSEFAARNLGNWLWITFTRSNPASDIDGFGAFTHQKHWGCTGPLVIDARIKPHHAPPLIEDPAVSRRVDELAARGGPLHGIL